MIIKIDGRYLVSTLCKNFKDEFGGTLRVYDGARRCDGSEKVRDLCTKEGGTYECRGNKSVGMFEKDMKDLFGLKVQVASADDFILALDYMTIAKVKEIPEKNDQITINKNVQKVKIENGQ